MQFQILIFEFSSMIWGLGTKASLGEINKKSLPIFTAGGILSDISISEDFLQPSFTWRTNLIRHEVPLRRGCYMWWHWLLKIEMKWEEANTNLYEILLSLNDTGNSIYLIIKVKPIGNQTTVVLQEVATWLLDPKVLSHMPLISVSK